MDKILIFPTRLVLSKRSRKVKRVLQQGNCHFPAMEEKKHINLTLSSFYSFSSLVHQDVNCEGSANSYMNIGIPKFLGRDFKIYYVCTILDSLRPHMQDSPWHSLRFFQESVRICKYVCTYKQVSFWA